MEQFSAKFVTEFHSLQGLTVAEKKRSLYQLFKSAEILHRNNVLLDTVTSQLKSSQTYLEELFFIEFLIHFRKYNELADAYLCGHHYAVKRCRKQEWFFKELINKLGPQFVTHVVPTLSYNLTLKILKEISMVINETQANEIFDSLFNIYGLFMTSKILISCSSDKIEDIFRNYAVKLSPKQLKSLYCKNPGLIPIYFQEMKKHQGNGKFMDFKQIFQFIAQNDLEMFVELCSVVDSDSRLGKRMTRKFILAKRSFIIANPEKYVKHLNQARLIKVLGPDFPKIFLQLFPKNIDEFQRSEVSKLLKHCPIKERYNLLATSYNKVFAKKLDEMPNLIDDYLLQMIVNPSERERLAKIKNSDNDDAYLRYYQPRHCLEIIKEKINFARDLSVRRNFVAFLAESCIVNKDYDFLLEAAKFVTQRFKNDDISVQGSFLRMMIHNKCDFKKFHEGHWEEINKILCRPEFNNLYDYTYIEILFKYTEFLIKSDKAIKDQVTELIKTKYGVNQYATFLTDAHAQKVFLLNCIEMAPQLTSDSNSALIEDLDCMLLSACQAYNLKYPKIAINVINNPRLLQSMRKVLLKKLKDRHGSVSLALQLLLCTENKTAEHEELRNLFWDNLEYATPFIMRWFLKYRPDFIQKNIVPFITFCRKNTELQNDKKLWQYVKCYRHLNIDLNTIQFCTSNMTPQDCKILSHLVSKADFLTLLESHRPEKLNETDEQDDISRKQFKIRIALLTSLKNVDSSVTSLSLIMDFCVGDYIPSCVNALSCALSNTPRNSLDNVVEKLKNHNVLLFKKLAYLIMTSIYEKPIVVNSLKHCQLGPYSITLSFQYFLKNPSEESWGIFMDKLQTLDKSDLRTSKLIATKPVATKYKAQHFESVWTILHRNNNKHRITLMKNVQIDVLELQSNFLEKVINEEFFCDTEVNKFFCIYIVTKNIDNTKEMIWKLLENYKESAQFSMQKVHDFMTTLFVTCMTSLIQNEHLIEFLLPTFQKMFSAAEIVEEYIIITLLKCKNENLDNFSKSVIELHKDLINQYGETITIMFADVLNKLLPHFSLSVPMYQFYYTLLTHSESTTPDVLLVIQLLPRSSEPEDVDNYKCYQNILSYLEQQRLSAIQLHLNLFFKYHKLETNVSYYNRLTTYCIESSSWLCFGAEKMKKYY